MSTNVPLPALGESVTEGTISRWLKEVGDTIEADEALVEVSTDKVDTEIPSPVAGVVLEILVAEDETAEVGATLAVIGDAAETSSDASTTAAPATETTPAAPAATEAPAPAEPPAAPPAPEAAAPAAAPAGSGSAGTGTEVTLPALGESVTEGTISRWLKEVGDTVEADEALVEVSTDKVDTEIPSPAAGTLVEIRVAEDETAEVGSVLAIIGEASSAAPADPPAAPAPAAAETPAAPETPEVAAAPAPTTPPPVVTEVPAPAPTPAAAPPASEPRRAAAEAAVGYVTPLVRKLATQNNIDLTTITGTGVGGRIRKQDVLAAAEAAKQAAAAPVSAAAPAAPPPASVAPDARRGTTEKMSRLRATIAKRMTESLQVAAQLTATVEVDLTAISRIR
ncbi:MAG: 2-oxoglutarate dehydrogenase, E2 component, dihydrolipoamide succinyltransferase, partial [Propioniciclava sp.]